MGPLRRQPFRRQVVMAAAVLLVPLIAGIAFSARRTRAERQQEVKDTAVSVAVTAAALLDESLRGLDALASGVTRHPAVLAPDQAQCEVLFRGLLRQQPILTNLALVDRSGRVRGSALPMGSGPIDRPWLAEVINTGTPKISDFQIGSVTKKPTVVLAYPVFDGEQNVIGVFGATVDLTRLQDVFARIPLPADSVVEVLDRTNRVLVRTRDAGRYVGQTIAGLEWGRLPRTVERTDLDGVDRFDAQAQASRVPWVVSVGVPFSTVAARLAPLWERNLAIAFSALIGSLLLLLLISGVVSRHLESLRRAVQRIAEGDLSPPVIAPVPNLELSRLQDTFMGMATNLRTTREALDRRMEQERRMNETLKSLQRRVVRQERLAAVGLLAAGIAHEINNPLQAILGAAELLERSNGPQGAGESQIAAIKAQGARAREIIRSLANFATPTARPLSAVQLSDVVEDVLRTRDRSELGPSVTIEIDITSANAVYASHDDLTQVGSHFLENAMQAVGASGGGRIAIRVRDVGRSVRFEVEDNGPGVAAEHESKLFQPFFTTRPVGTGMGMSLSVSYGIILSLGGTIGHERPTGGGALFFFELTSIDGSESDHDDRAAVLQRPV